MSRCENDWQPGKQKSNECLRELYQMHHKIRKYPEKFWLILSDSLVENVLLILKKSQDAPTPTFDMSTENNEQRKKFP